MIWRCFDSLLVLAAFTAVYLIPPLLVLRRLVPSVDRATLFLVSTGLGLSAQALLGFCWNHFVGRAPIIVGVLYFLVWLLAGVALARWKNNPSSPDRPPAFNQAGAWLPLSLVLLAGISIRSVDALAHASLGQSDAYTHLQFLRDVFQYGEIRNIVYPPGYSWALALPVMTFNLDAYMVTRYVGAFFGSLLIITLYLLGYRHSRAAGLFAAFLAAVCPAFYPLIKTGMGAFANQMGLFLLPLALLLYLQNYRLLFAITLLGLTVSVPLFTFTLALIVVLHRLLMCRVSELSGENTLSSDPTIRHPSHSTTATSKTSGRWLRESLLILLPFLLAFALAGYHFLSPGKLHVSTTAALVTGISTPSKKLMAPVATEKPDIMTRMKFHPAGKLVLDLLTAKRLGLGSLAMNLAVLGLAGIFSITLLVAFRQSLSGPSSTFLKLVGAWGLITTLQAATGLLEFSFYQRSGWLLMEAGGLAGGLILARLYCTRQPGKLLRGGIKLGMGASLIVAFWFPPQHRCITSGAENELATALRELSAARLEALDRQGPRTMEQMHPSPLIARAAALPDLIVVTRRYTLFNADQGNMADVLPDPAAGLRQLPVNADTRLTPPARHFICFIDRYSGLPPRGILDRITPALGESLADYQPLLYKPNEVIETLLDSLPESDWTITRESRGTNLTIVLAKRQ